MIPALLLLAGPARGPLVWRDEFNGNRLDPTKWEAPAMDRQGSEASKWHPSEVRVEKGVLILGARRIEGPGPKFVCGAVRTRAAYDPTRTMFGKRYGIFEIRARFFKNLRTDAWFAFWLMAGDIRDDQLDSRKGSEIDVLETFHATKNRLNHAIHWGGYGKTHNSFNFESGEIPDLQDGKFHVYTLRWTPKEYAVYRDGKLLAQTSAVGLGKEGLPPSQGPVQEPGYLKLTVEAAPWAGPDWRWEPDAPAYDEAQVDWIRVYDLPTK